MQGGGLKVIGPMLKGKDMNFKENSICSFPNEDRIRTFENFNKIRLPNKYVLFINQFNGGEPIDLTLTVEGEERLIEKFLCLLDDPHADAIAGQYEIGVVLSQIEDRLTDDEDQIGAVIIPFAALFGGDFLCMDYRGNKYPKVVVWVRSVPNIRVSCRDIQQKYQCSDIS